MDFGTGHSSLSYIHSLPIKTVKIDRSFVQDIVASRESMAIVRAIVAMSQSLGLTVIAEGVETQDQCWSAVTKVGCDAAQGYLFSAPLNSDSAGKLLTAAPSPRPPASQTTR
jgi:EAL domain-containing protein (putative c-di-GMP-specific phosphodiesterase class I)